MVTSDDNYTVELTSGDPRNLEYSAGLISPYVLYRQVNLHLTFRLVGHLDDSSLIAQWTLVAPANLRSSLGASYPRRDLVIRRIQDYLQPLDIEHPYTLARYPIGEVAVDTSQVASWLSVAAEKCSSTIAPIARNLPSKKTAPFLASGLLVQFLDHQGAFLGTSDGWIQPVLVLAGSVSLVRLGLEMRHTYTMSARVSALLASTKRTTVNWRLTAATTTVRAFGLRYGTTAALAVHLLYWGLQT
jgi:hypothetical protein